MILVTGGGGFIGREVCQNLTGHHHDVLATDLTFPSSMPCQTMQGDLSDFHFQDTLFQAHSIDTIIHLAGMLNKASRAHPEQAVKVNIGASLKLLESGLKNEIKRFIFGSSIGVYGFKSYAHFANVSEVAPAAPDDVYGASKRFVEIVGEQYRRQARLEFVALRIAMVVGPGARNTASPWRSEIFEAIKATEPTSISLPYSRLERLPLIYIADVAECIRRLLEAGQTEHTLYNTPADNWQCGELAEYIHALNENIDFTFSPSQGRGDPEAIDGSRFTEEFGFSSIPIKNRLHWSMENND